MRRPVIDCFLGVILSGAVLTTSGGAGLLETRKLTGGAFSALMGCGTLTSSAASAAAGSAAAGLWK
jgi:hypothetical protein